MSSDDIAISVRNISKCYHIYARPQDRLKQYIMPRLQKFLFRQPKNYYHEFWALRDISFDVRKGETVGIIGVNGSGKSTLLQIISGTLTPTSGTVRTNGRLAALLELGSGFNPEFTGRENVYMNGQVLGLTKDEIDAKIDEIISFADIGEFIDRPVKMYSSGMFVRLAFAVQTCVDPDILIVDEALAVGDERFQRKGYERLEKLRSKGTSILLVTHSTTIIERFCQRAILLHKGELLSIGPSKQIVDQYHSLLYGHETKNTNERSLHKNSNSIINDLKVNKSTLDTELYKIDREKNFRAKIISYDITNEAGNYTEIFRPGETAIITIRIQSFDKINELQVGISIKTLEGVLCFGTSTLYLEKNCKNVKPGEIITVRFRISLDLCEGAYAISFALAEAFLHSGMVYLDKLIDVIIFKISEPRMKAAGIAYLPSEVDITRGVSE